MREARYCCVAASVMSPDRCEQPKGQCFAQAVIQGVQLVGRQPSHCWASDITHRHLPDGISSCVCVCVCDTSGKTGIEKCMDLFSNIYN